MKPITFKEQNMTYVADGGNDLPVYKGDNQIISCWKLSEEDIKRINETGTIWFSVFSQAQPPIWMGTETPFTGPEVETDRINSPKDLTYGDLIKMFRKEYPIYEIKDYRPMSKLHAKANVDNAITIWTDKRQLYVKYMPETDGFIFLDEKGKPLA